MSMMCARSVMRSRTALHSRAFGITWVHSENGKIRRQDQRRALGPVGDDLKQQLGADVGERDVADLVNGDQVIPRPAGEHAGELHRVLRFDQLIDQRGGGREPDPPLLPTGRDAQAREQMGLAGPTVADQHDGLGARQCSRRRRARGSGSPRPSAPG